MSDEEKKKLQRMSEALRTGATMLPDQCPVCGSPLFKIKDETWCLNCNRQVVIVKEGEEAPNLVDTNLLGDVEVTALEKLQDINQQVKNEKDPEKLQELGSLISTWLEVLEKLKRIRKP
ncbi:MAG: hypothetical protein QG670_162 [Thermoproteota archaeon]|nr:hypothetical protein [Thermoproteota archaeon]